MNTNSATNPLTYNLLSLQNMLAQLGDRTFGHSQMFLDLSYEQLHEKDPISDTVCATKNQRLET